MQQQKNMEGGCETTFVYKITFYKLIQPKKLKKINVYMDQTLQFKNIKINCEKEQPSQGLKN